MWTILPDAFYVLCRAVRTKQKKKYCAYRNAQRQKQHKHI